ncbi:MAG TPA: zinc ribbon domain-containing protein [Tepidisphaeraceae bacterium]|nr:zinc ribbon domain-containing protein [Tepidisphaeraceae bacterium]
MEQRPTPIPTDRAFPCPACGYDLRAMAGGRCPECGIAVDREALRVSAIPWAHRRRRGFVRAYLATARRFIRGGRGLVDEPLRPQELGDARAFARVTGAILAMLLVWIWVAVLTAAGGGQTAAGAERVYAHFAWQPESPVVLFGAAVGVSGEPRPGWKDDFHVPWSAGATLWWVMPVGLALLGFHLAGVQRTIFRAPGRSAEVRRVAEALGAYTAAPLLLLVPAAVCAAAAVAMAFTFQHGEAPVQRANAGGVAAVVLVVVAIALYLVALVGTFLRVGQWLVRAAGAGPGRVALGLVELGVLWCVGIGLFVFALPWGVGFVRIVIDAGR